MNVKRLLERVPSDREAEERAWSVVRAAYAEREHVRVRPRHRLMLAGVALAAVVAASAFSSPGRAVVNAATITKLMRRPSACRVRAAVLGFLRAAGTRGNG